MSDPAADGLFEERLRAHLSRVAATPPRSGLEQRVIARISDDPQDAQRAGWRAGFGVVAVMVVAITTLILLTTGHQVGNVFSNISSGLAA
jgi:hypothetical protein